MQSVLTYRHPIPSDPEELLRLGPVGVRVSRYLSVRYCPGRELPMVGEGDPVAASGLGSVHRRVGFGHEILLRLGMVRKAGNPNTRRQFGAVAGSP